MQKQILLAKATPGQGAVQDTGPTEVGMCKEQTTRAAAR